MTATTTALDPRRVITRVIPDDDRPTIPTATDKAFWLHQAAATADTTWAKLYMTLAHQA